jgi:hypothetical protein
MMMLTMHTSVAALSAASVLVIGFGAWAGGLTPAERAAGWVTLFDGASTDQWRGFSKEGFPEQGWVVEDGALRVMANGGGGDIITRSMYENFELTLQWKVAANANSGIMYRVREEGFATWNTGPEFQILDDSGHGLTADHINSSGALYDLMAPSADKAVKPAGEWNDTRIRLVNGRVEHWLNGVQVLVDELDGPDFASRVAASKFNAYANFGKHKKGHLALQDHGNDVWFRDIRVRDLDTPLPGEINLFNGKDLAGWLGVFNDGGKMPDVFKVEDGLLVCAGNPVGYIRTETAYTNFVLKLEWRWNPRTMQVGNGGVLVRVQEPDKVWPRSIEAQLHGGNAGDIWNIDAFDMKTAPERTTGRRTQKTAFAELNVGEWNEYEIICDGPDITLRVNGQTVNRAWEAAEIAGFIAFQSEGAEMHFRRIRLAPIAR